ncbi:Uncharacterized protein ABC855_g3995 [[Candida] zeylanoides]
MPSEATADSLVASLEGLSPYDAQDVLDQLVAVAKPTQLLRTFNAIVDQIFYGALTLSQKSFMVKHLLTVPLEDGSLPISVCLRIIGCLGKPMRRSGVAHGDTPLKWHKSVPFGLQHTLLKWLVCHFHWLGADAAAMASLLPLLFHALAYEFSRALVANLVFLILVNADVSLRGTPVRRWQLRLVLDLHLRFPTDDALKSLLVVFRWLDPAINYKKINPLVSLQALRPAASLGFEYPGNELPDDPYRAVLEANLGHYRRFNQRLASSKRQRVATAEISLDLDVVDFSKRHAAADRRMVSVHEVSSLRALVEEFVNIRFVNVGVLYEDAGTARAASVSANRFRLLYAALEVSGGAGAGASALGPRLDYLFRLTVLDDALAPSQLGHLVSCVETMAWFGGAMPPSAHQFALFALDPPMAHPEVLAHRVRLLRYLSPAALEAAVDDGSLVAGLAAAAAAPALGTILDALAAALPSWPPPIAARFLNQWLPIAWPLVAGQAELALSQFLHCVRRHINVTTLDAAAVVAPPTVVYAMVLSLNPWVVSEACGYVAWCKQAAFTDSTAHARARAWQNAYVMDILNFVWRDQAFKADGGFSRGMFLHRDFVDASSIASNMLPSLSVVGNLFHNPAWAYVSAEIVRNLEDASEGVAVRHAGPPSPESVQRLSGEQWLGVDYDELRVLVLRQLDRDGFEGLAELLYGSLKTLAGRRSERSAERSRAGEGEVEPSAAPSGVQPSAATSAALSETEPSESPSEVQPSAATSAALSETEPSESPSELQPSAATSE